MRSTDSRQAQPAKRRIRQLAVISDDQRVVDIYNRQNADFSRGRLSALTNFPTDQVLLARILADRQGCILHAAGIVLDGKGFLFVGHSEAGKTTLATMLRHRADILCDDRIIVRKWASEFKIHGTWMHGDLAEIRPDEAPLHGILFLEKDTQTRLEPIFQKREAVGRLLACAVKPMLTADWWHKTISLTASLAADIPCYCLHFDKSGSVVDLLERVN
jgi:hypothetical protein